MCSAARAVCLYLHVGGQIVLQPGPARLHIWCEHAKMATSADRYQEKIGKIGGTDPYHVPTNKWKDISCFTGNSLPQVEYPDVYHYLINTPGHDGSSLRNYKSLNAYQYFFAGNVQNILLAPSGK